MYGIRPPPIEAEAYEIKISLVRMIQESKFLGTNVENPYDHLDSFERLCDTFRTGGVPHDSIKLILFPFSLGDKASQWERSLPSHLVTSWADCKMIFLNKFYPIQRTLQTRRDILNFKQGVHETFHEAWARLKGYTRDCPHHGFKKDAILCIFYLGIDQEHKRTVDAASHGRFKSLTVEQGEQLVENFAQSEENCGEDYLRPHLGSEKHDDQGREEIKALHARMDKQLAIIEMQSNLLDKLLIASKRYVHCAKDFNDNQRLENLENQHAQGNPLSSEPMEDLKGKVDETPSEYFKVVFSDVESEEALRKVERVLHGSKEKSMKRPMIEGQCFYFETIEVNDDEVSVEDKVEEIAKVDAIQAPRVQSMSSFSMRIEDNPPRTGFEKKGSQRKKESGITKVEPPRVESVGCFSMFKKSSPPRKGLAKKKLNEKEDFGNDEEALALDGDCLASLFHTNRENEFENFEDAKEKTKAIGKKKDGSRKFDAPKFDLGQPSTMILIPWKHENGVIEYKVKCRGRSKPFASVKAILTPEIKAKGEPGLQEAMRMMLELKLKDPPWSVHTPLSHT